MSDPFPFDPLFQRYPSQRFPLYARGGMVNCSSPQAAAAGLEVLRKGGNAMDAAVAAAAALTVVEPTANGIGSDAFALIWSEKDQKLFCLNSSGPAPQLLSIDRVMADGRAVNGKMPVRGWTPITVSGAPGAWAAIQGRFGRLSLSEDLAPAVRYAQEGYPCAPNLSAMWRISFDNFSKNLTGPEFKPWFDTFCPNGRVPKAGEMICLPDHAATLRRIGETNAEVFYRGDIARRIDEQSRRDGGYIRYEDYAAFRPRWVEPISVNYRGFDVCEIPPNGQGITALMALNILKEFTFTDRDDATTVHRQLEAMKMAFADAFRYVTDPEKMELDYHDLLDPAYGAMRAREMGERARPGDGGEGPDLDPSAAAQERHRVPLLCRRGGEHDLLHPVQLHGIRLRHRGGGDGHFPSEPGRGLFSGPRRGQLPYARQADLPHHHPRFPHEG